MLDKVLMICNTLGYQILKRFIVMSDREIISRKEAKSRGLKKYFTGKPCKHGHIAERYVDGGGCKDCI